MKKKYEIGDGVSGQVHRFRDYVAIHLADSSTVYTVYLTPKIAAALGKALSACAKDIRTQPSFSDSTFKTAHFLQLRTGEPE